MKDGYIQAYSPTKNKPISSMLKKILFMQRKYLNPEDDTLTFAKLIQNLNEDQFHHFLDYIPEGITKREFIKFSLMIWRQFFILRVSKTIVIHTC